MFKTKPIKKVMALVLSIILTMAIMPIQMIAANNDGYSGITPHTNTTLRWVADSVEVAHDATYVDITIHLENAYSFTHGVTMTLALQGAAGLSLPADAYRGAVTPNTYTVTPQSIIQNPAIFGIVFNGPFEPASVVNATVRINLDAGLVADTPSYVLLSRPPANIHQLHQTFFSITRLPTPVHTVTFNLHGGTGAFPTSFPPQDVPNNQVATRPSADPTRAGYNFVDWYTSATGGVPFDFANTPITENTVVHARWVPEQQANTGLRWLSDNITIPFDATYVDVLISLENLHTITNNVTMTLALGPDGATGATGLSIPAVPLQSHNTPNGVIVTPASALPAYIFSLEVEGPQTFASLDTTLLVRINTSAALLPNVPTTVRLSRPHLSPHATEITTFTITRLPEGPIYHNVTFDLQGGGLAANFPALTVLNNDTITRPTAVPTLANHTFVDWYDAATGGAPFDFAAPITADTVIYARWTPVLHPVTFNLHDGGPAASFPAQNVPHNGTATQPPTVPTRAGFDFVGWYDAATGGAPFDFTTEITGPTTVHARWAPVEGNHLVTFVLHGGAGNFPDQSVPNNGNATRPSVNPTRAGFNFVNWYTSATGGTPFNFTTPITADTTIHARWVAQPTTPPGGSPGGPGPGGTGPGGSGQTPQDPAPPADDNDNDNDNENDNYNDNDNDNEVLIPIDPTPVIQTHYAYMIGFEDGTVRPQANITRAEATTIFFRLISDAHRSGILSRSNVFSDVAPAGWYNTAISTMDNGGFVAGYPDGSFRPNQSITRAEMTALVVRFMGYGHLTNVQGNTFSDAEGHWAQDAITVASRRGWVTGFEDGTFRPNQPITRAETAALVNRMLDRLPENSDDLLDDMLTWPDNMNVNAWYYLYIQEATNSHYHVMKADGIHETWTQLIEPRDWRSIELPD